MATLAALVSEARGILQDRREPYRYSDDDLLNYARDAVVAAFRVRPDLRIGVDWLRDDTDFPSVLEDYWAPSVEYVTAAAELRDDQFSQDGRAAALLQKFRASLMSTGL